MRMASEMGGGMPSPSPSTQPPPPQQAPEPVGTLDPVIVEDRGGAGDVVRQDRPWWITIDASRSIEQVTNEIWTAIEPLIHGTSEPLGRLWTTEGDSG
jgi:hypothetical protein